MRDTVRSAFRLRPVRFVTVGVGAAALLFVLAYLFALAGLSGFGASVLAYLIAFAVAYAAQQGWTFGGVHAHSHALPRYFAVQMACALFSGVVGHVSVERFGAPPLAMSALVTLAASAASYVLSSLWVFPARRP